MDPTWSTALWQQFGAAIDMLDNALAASTVSLWHERLWPNPPHPLCPPQFAEFWYVSFHALVGLDLCLAGIPEKDFAPPAPFAQGPLDSMESMPVQPYTKEELRAYLASLRELCRTTLGALTEERARRTVEYADSGRQPISYL